MNKDELTPFNARPESTVFAELAELCQSSGYAHAIAYFCWRDNIIRYDGEGLKPGDVEHMHSGERLVRTEISTLIGLMVRQPIDWGIRRLQPCRDTSIALNSSYSNFITPLQAVVGRMGSQIRQTPGSRSVFECRLVARADLLQRRVCLQFPVLRSGSPQVRWR